MKRIALLNLLVATVFITLQARGAEEAEFKYGGEFRARYFDDLNSTGRDAPSGQQADTTARFKFNVGVRKGEKLQAYLSLLNNTQFGAQNTTNGDYSSVNTPVGAAPTNAQTSTNNLVLVSRAWGLWKASDSVSIRVGRFGIEIADGSVFSDNDWENVPTAHEGMEIAFDSDYAKFSIFGVKTNELALAPSGQSGAPSSDPERNMYIVSAEIKNLPDLLKTANVHFVQTVRDRSDSGGGAPTVFGAQNWQHVGLTLGGDARGVFYKLTAAMQMGSFSKLEGSDQKLNSSMYDGLLGYSAPDALAFKGALGFHMDSGNDSAAALNVPPTADQRRYQSLYYDQHWNAGLMDVLRWGNLTYWDATASFQPADDFELGAGYYIFTRTQTNDPAGPNMGGRYPDFANGAGTTDKSLGSEIDVYGVKSYDNSLKLTGRLGGFLPGDYFKNGTIPRSKPILQAMVEGVFDF